MTSWWFQPIWKIWVKRGISSPIFGVKMKTYQKKHHLPAYQLLPFVTRNDHPNGGHVFTPWKRSLKKHTPLKVTNWRTWVTWPPTGCWSFGCLKMSWVPSNPTGSQWCAVSAEIRTASITPTQGPKGAPQPAVGESRRLRVLKWWVICFFYKHRCWNHNKGEGLQWCKSEV